MTDDFKYDVFLCHSSKDKAFALGIAEQLRADKVRVWLDEWELRPGDNIHARIEEGLEQSRVLVLCMSGNAFGSDWTQLESYTFRFRDPLNKSRRFIPLRLDEADIKGSLAQFLYINWSRGERRQEYEKLLAACRAPRELLAEANPTSEKVAEEKGTDSSAFSPNRKRTLSTRATIANTSVDRTDVDVKRERLYAMLERHLDYARDIIEARSCGDRRLLEWSSDFRRDTMSILNATGWAIFQRQLDADSATGKWELGDIPGRERFKVTITDGVEQTIHRIQISPDHDRFKLIIQSLPPLVARLPPEAFK